MDESFWGNVFFSLVQFFYNLFVFLFQTEEQLEERNRHIEKLEVATVDTAILVTT